MKTVSTRGNLISTDNVEGTEVYGTGSEHIGEIHSLVIDKRSGQIVYAMMSFGGFLGLGKSYYPIPWNALNYDPEQGGYRTDLTEAQVKNAPVLDPDILFENTGDDWNRRLYKHYGMRGYWDQS